MPWPSADLSPNKRLHWSRVSKAKKAARAEAAFLAGKCPEFDGKLHLHITFHPPANRHYDIDNLLARMKAALDGVADAWGVNDKCFRPITIDDGAKVKGGKVVISWA